MSRVSNCPCAWPCNGVDRNAPLMEDSTQITWSRGDVLWAEEDEADWVLAVCTGAVGLRRGPTESPRLVDLVVRGELAGEETATSLRRTTGCVGLTAGKGRRLAQRDLKVRLRVVADGWQSLLEVSSARLASMAGGLEAASQARVEARLAALFDSLAQRAGLPDARGVMIPLKLSRGDLASLVGCREETIVRQMRRWSDDGLLDTNREGFVVRDRVALQVIRGVEPTAG